MTQRILVLMGATGTGKSALALELAQRSPTVIINADAMQLYADLRILTARPSDAEMARAEHVLYGVLPAREQTSAARWLALVKPAIEAAWEAGKQPLLVGGTGMYITALMDGLADVPEIPGPVREEVRALAPEARFAALREKDPAMAARVKPGDTQRIARALEVILATGTSLAEWQAKATKPLFPEAAYRCFALEMPRAALYARLDARFLAMLAQGALDEVRNLGKLNLPKEATILRATGVPELRQHLSGALSYGEAVAKGQQHTRNYAKRQGTWIRHQMSDIITIFAEANPSAAAQADFLQNA